MGRRLLLAITLIIPLLSACELVGVRGSGTMATETRQVSDFSQIDLRGSGRAIIEVTGTETLTIRAEDNLIPLLTSEVTDGRLVLGTIEPISPTTEIVYTISVESLDGVSIGGSGELSATAIEASDFEASVSGSGLVTLEDLSTGDFRVAISGSGDIEVSGSADHLDLSVSGSGSYRGESLVASTGNVEVTGSGDAVVNVEDHLEAVVNGSGSIEYLGDPTVDSSISGSGEIEQR